MTDAQTILEMIEAVDPEDSETLDEIDRVVFWFERELDAVAITITVPRNSIPRYTRSRDALKAIRPEGWVVSSVSKANDCFCTFYRTNTGIEFKVGSLPTEELAELHAIIQALEYERREGEL